MNKLMLLTLIHLATGAVAVADVITQNYASGFDNGGLVLDGNVNPWSDTRAVSAAAGQVITDVSVRLSLSGGYNGDLYGYLSYNGVQVPLLNRVGVGTGDAFGYGDAGLSVTFNDGAADNIHFYQAVVGYSIAGGAAWQPDGRALNPVTASASAYDAAGTGNRLSAFSGMDPNGSWSLVLADVSGGGGQSVVTGWGLSIGTATSTAVPEPSTVAMGLVTLLGLAVRRFAPWRRNVDPVPASGSSGPVAK
jgi:hypothetical protein